MAQGHSLAWEGSVSLELLVGAYSCLPPPISLPASPGRAPVRLGVDEGLGRIRQGWEPREPRLKAEVGAWVLLPRGLASTAWDLVIIQTRLSLPQLCPGLCIWDLKEVILCRKPSLDETPRWVFNILYFIYIPSSEVGNVVFILWRGKEAQGK